MVVALRTKEASLVSNFRTRTQTIYYLMSIRPGHLKLKSYYLVESNHRGVLALIELSDSQYRSAIGAVHWLHLYHYHKRRQQEVTLNLGDFFERYAHYEKSTMTQSYEKKHEFFVLAFIDLNRVLTNFLSSFRLFVDNLEVFFKKEYGESSQQYLRFKQVIRHEFDTKFEYRFLYRLRNYSQHKGFPIASVGMDNEVEPYTRETRRTFTVKFSKDKFLKDDPDNFKHLIHDFLLYAKEFPVLAPLAKIKKCLAVIGAAIDEIEKEKIVAASNELLGYFKYLEDDGDLGFAQLTEQVNGKGMFDSVEIPINILREVYREVEGGEPGF